MTWHQENRRVGLATAFLLLTTIASAAAQGNFYRSADGRWHELQTTVAGDVATFVISPEAAAGRTTMVVLSKPAWMVVEDEEAPTPVRILVDGKETKPEAMDLGRVEAAPQEVAFAARDDKNPLDFRDVAVRLNGLPVPNRNITVTRLTPDGKCMRVAVRPGSLKPDRYALAMSVADRSPFHNVLTLTLTFSTAPLVCNGSFEEVDRNNNPLGWNTGIWSSDAQTSYEIAVRTGGVAGQRALCFKGIAGSLNMVCHQRTSELRAGVVYVFSGSYKGEGGAALSVITSGGKTAEYLTQALNPAKDWTPFSWEFKLQEHLSADVVVRSGAKGETWFDDVKIVEKRP